MSSMRLADSVLMSGSHFYLPDHRQARSAHAAGARTSRCRLYLTGYGRRGESGSPGRSGQSPGVDPSHDRAIRQRAVASRGHRAFADTPEEFHFTPHNATVGRRLQAAHRAAEWSISLPNTVCVDDADREAHTATWSPSFYSELMNRPGARAQHRGGRSWAGYR